MVKNLLDNAKVIAYYKIRQHFPSVEIVKDCPYYDLLVASKEGTAQFAAKIIIEGSKDYDTVTSLYENVLSSAKTASELRIPILLFNVDMNNGALTYQQFLKWNYNVPFVNNPRDAKPIEWNEKNAHILMAEMDKVIRVLPASLCSVIKTITISDNRYIEASVVYARKLWEGYKMKEQPANITQSQSIDRYLNGIPEEEYPNDVLDDMILAAVQSVYKDSKKRSSILLFNTELRDLQHYSNSKLSTEKILFTPESSALLDFLAVNPSGVLPSIDITVAYTPNMHYLPDGEFEGGFTYECSMEQLKTLAELLTTYRPLSYFLSKK